MKFIFFDIETFCELDLIEVGLERYVRHRSFEINLIGWTIWLAEKEQPEAFQQAEIVQPEYWISHMDDPDTIFIAHNAPFEIRCMEKVLKHSFNLQRVICTQVWAYQTGLPGSLDRICEVLRLENKKLKSGTSLINYFAKPCTPSKANGLRKRNYPYHNMAKWENYREYNKYDVLVLVELYAKVLRYFPQPSFEHDYWILDQRINRSGLRIDIDLLSAINEYIAEWEMLRKAELKDLTNLDNPNSTQQLRLWFNKMIPNIVCLSIAKASLLEIQKENKDPKVNRVIELRKELAKTSLKKYTAVENALVQENLYYLFQFNGAERTGRWAGRKPLQVHNLPKNKNPHLDQLRKTYKDRSRPITASLPFELSELIRTLIIPEDGTLLGICDYSAIEARIGAWYAKEDWVLDVFRGEGKIYEATAARMFDCKVGEVDEDMRQNGKTAVLACGFGGGEKAIERFQPLWPVEKRLVIVNYWRDQNPNIVRMWRKLNNAALHCIKNHTTVKVENLTFHYRKRCMLIELPSGRKLTYLRAKVTQTVNNYGNQVEQIQYEGKTDKGCWSDCWTYGGKLFENIVQATARDILANALYHIDKAGYEILFHVHDEVIWQSNGNDLNEIKKIMCENPVWAEGLPLAAEGFYNPYYKKEDK